MEAARLAQRFALETGRDALFHNPMCKAAVVRQLELVGEATKRLSEGLDALRPEVPWRTMAGMRDVLIHGYDEIDLVEVWKTAKTDLPDVIGLLAGSPEEIGDPE